MANGKAGGTWRHNWTYQGYRVHGGMFRRDPGLTPGGGYVDIDYKDLGSLKVDAGPFWAGGDPGPKDILAASKGGGPGRTQTAGGSGGGGNVGGGLKRFGPLVMQSTFNGKALPALVYEDIFVGSGTEELAVGISDARAHNKGKVRVQLTDIRSTYKHGAFFGRINCRMASSGNWVRSTTKNGKGSPWTAIQVFEFLFSELPGSPGIDPQSQIYAAQFRGSPPVDLEGEGEPIIHVLDQLLARYGLVARLLPDNSYFLGNDLGGDYGPGQYAEDVGNKVNAEHIREERKSISFSPTRSAAVMVVGKRRVRSITVPYVPVIKDPKSGRIFPMTDKKCRDLGMQLKDVKEQVFRNSERSFREVSPKYTREGDKRRQMFREWAYRVYAPAAAFGKAASGTQGGAGDGMLEEEFADIPFMPMREAPWLRSDLAKHGITTNVSSKPGSGAFKEWILHPPVVWAAGFRQDFFKDFEAIKEFFDLMLEGEKNASKMIDSEIEKYGQAIRDLGPSISKADAEMAKRFNAGDANSKYAFNGSFFIGLLADVAEAVKEKFSGSAKTLSASMNSGSLEALQQKNLLENSLKIWKELSGKTLDSSRKWKNKFKEFKEAFEFNRGVLAWANFPHGVMMEGSYSLDSQTGLLKFHDLMCKAEQPFLLQPDGAVAIGDGAVMVNFGYEIKNNLLSDFTSVLFVAKDSPNESVTDGPSAISAVSACGMNRSCGIKPVTEKDPNLRLYENSAGQPFNVTEVVTQAASRAVGQLRVPRAAIGYTYVLQGLRKAVLDAGISSVQHEYDGKRAATTVMVNALGGRGPLGAPQKGGEGKRGDADRRDDIGRAEEGR